MQPKPKQPPKAGTSALSPELRARNEAHAIEAGLDVMDGRAEPVECCKMLGHAVAHVALEAVTRMRRAEPHHQAITCYFGDDRGGGDRGDQTIAIDDRLTIAARIDAVTAIDKD